MPEARRDEDLDDRIIAIGFRVEASADEVVARLFESVRRTDISLLQVFGDGDRVYPFEGRNPARSASSWRAELFCVSPASKAGLHLEVFLARAELFLDLPGEVRLVVAGGRRRSEKEVVG